MSFDPRLFIEHYLAESAAERRAIAERSVAALTKARRIAQLIRKADPDVRSVILFGSLAEGDV